MKKPPKKGQLEAVNRRKDRQYNDREKGQKD